MGEVIIQTTERPWATKTPRRDICPDNVIALGSTGLNTLGTIDWIGWDIDVGHGGDGKHYTSTFVAIQAARMIRERVGRETEIRLSKSGRGVHVKRMLQVPVSLATARKAARDIADELGIRADPTALSRQAFWLWCSDPGPDSFRLIEAADVG